ncbi:hypothetical protein M8U09_07100, partial [Enterobacter hormaechei]|nr:hypothetical protein [Enterobacter hormaechei]
LMMSLWDALRMNMMISYQELVRTFLNVPDSLSGARIFHLSMAPETGWYIRRGHQSPKENILMTEDRFFQTIDCLA